MVVHIEDEKLVGLIQQAVMAPSSHNTQPWLFRVSPAALDLFADRTRALPVNDPEDLELIISCGCALMNLRIAAAESRLELQIQLIPDRDEPDWLARISIAGQSEARLPEAELVGFISQRRTYRKRVEKKRVEADVIDELADAARAESAWLHPLLTEEFRLEVAALVAEGDAVQWANPSWRRELAVWMHPRRRGDGLTVPWLAGPVAQLVVRTFDMGSGVGAKDRQLAEGSPLLAVLATDGDDERDWQAAGQALQRVLLTGCRLGLQASYLNQPIQVATLRPKLRKFLGNGFPQILLRFGYPAVELPQASRRAVEAVIDRTG
jgi:hypothetical protein